jgi:hypothetical protein
MRLNRPQPGPLDPKIAPAQPGAGAAHFGPANGTSATNSAPPQAPQNHPTLIKLAQLLGRQVARNASVDGGADD